MQRILQRFLKKVKKPLVFEGCSGPLFGILDNLCRSGVERHRAARSCDSRSCDSFFFYPYRRIVTRCRSTPPPAAGLCAGLFHNRTKTSAGLFSPKGNTTILVDIPFGRPVPHFFSIREKFFCRHPMIRWLLLGVRSVRSRAI